ncbi:MAG TPA: glutathione peroxidase [Stellaceae bacterium]|nr:glutathione peroxidase [Stellaceae bacterium]
MSAHDFEFTSIDGEPFALARFAGKLLLVVNTASECGLTPQYRGLQALWERYRDRGLVVLGVPCNDFGAQEPGSEAEIKRFCSTQYKVGFPLTAKNAVIGGKAHPFYKWAVEQAGAASAPRWNFHKFLIGPDGSMLGSFASTVAPDDKGLVAAIEAHLPK